MDKFQIIQDDNKIVTMINGDVDNGLIGQMLQTLYIIVGKDVNTIDVQNKIFENSGLDEKYNCLNKVWGRFCNSVADVGGYKFESLDEFLDVLEYMPLDVRRTIFYNINSEVAVNVRNKKFTSTNAAKLKLSILEKKLKDLKENFNEDFFDEFLTRYNIEIVSERQEEVLKNFFKNVFQYSNILKTESYVKFIKEVIPTVEKIDKKLGDKLTITVPELREKILKHDPTLNTMMCYDDLTDEYYSVVGVDFSKFKDEKEILKSAILGKNGLMFLGRENDKINLVTGKTVCDCDKNIYSVDTFLYDDWYLKFLLYFLSNELYSKNLNMYRDCYNDIISVATTSVKFNEFSDCVDVDLYNVVDKGKFSKMVSILSSHPKLLEKYLKEREKKAKRFVENMHTDAFAECEKFNAKLKHYKKVYESPFQEFM